MLKSETIEEINLSGEFGVCFTGENTLVSPDQYEIVNSVPTPFPQKSILEQLSSEASKEVVADLSRVTYLINKFLKHQFCNIIQENVVLFVKSIESLKVLLKLRDLNKLTDCNNEFVEAAHKIIEFDERLKARIRRKDQEEKSKLISKYDQCKDKNQMLSLKRKRIDEKLLKAIRNLNNREDIKNYSINTTAESSPSYHLLETTEDYNLPESKPNSILPLNINTFINISDLNYGVKGILKLPNESETSNNSIKRIAWDQNNLTNEKIFLFSEEPVLDEISPEEYFQIHLILRRIRETITLRKSSAVLTTSSSKTLENFSQTQNPQL